MNPAARVACSIELLTAIFESWESQKRIPADKLMDGYFRARRFMGSKDRGAAAELVYWILRHKTALEWWVERLSPHASGARGVVVAALLLRGDATPETLPGIFNHDRYAPPPLTDSEWHLCRHLAADAIEHPEMPAWVRFNYPQWMQSLLQESLGDQLESEMRALNTQAPVDLRVNTLKINRASLLVALNQEGFGAIPTPQSPLGIRLGKRAAIFASPLFKRGYFEMQDEGSQIAALLVDAKPGQKVIDFCAGAGGKTLALAAMMQNKGRILAWDSSKKRLGQLPARLRRAGVDNVQIHVIASEQDSFIKRHKNSADRVVVDAPCSGSGTWRRNPDLKWRFCRRDLDETLDAQRRILTSAARLVKPGGRLVYITCSLLVSENESQVDEFLKERNDFKVVCAKKIWNNSSVAREGESPSFLRITPRQDGADGFFAAVLERATVV